MNSAPSTSAVQSALPDPLAKNVALFKEQGFFVLEGALSKKEIEAYKAAIHRLAKSSTSFVEGGYMREGNLLERDPAFWDLLDQEKTYPYVTRLMGEDVRIMSTEAIVRPREGDDPVRWHDDGPSSPPYRALATPAPLCQLKIGYFLTDLPTDAHGNLVVIPGSHLYPDRPPEDLPHGLAAPNAVSLKMKAGDAVIFHNALWHCVAQNTTDQPRYSLYYGYCYPWMARFDNSGSSLMLRNLLTGRRRRMLMEFESPSTNYDLLAVTWRGRPGAAALAPLRIWQELLIRRAKVLKRRILG